MREDGRPGNLSSSAVTRVPSAPERIAGRVGPRRSVGGAAVLRGWSGRPGRRRRGGGAWDARAEPPGKAGGRVGREGRGAA